MVVLVLDIEPASKNGLSIGSPLSAQGQSVEKAERTVVSVASVAAAAQIEGNFRKQQKTPIVRDVTVSGLTALV